MIRKNLPRWLSLLGIMIFGILTVVSFFSTRRMYTGSESVYREWDNVLIKMLYLGVILAICGLLIRAQKLLTLKRVHIAAVVISVLATIICIILTNGAKSIPDADQWYVYVAAEGLFYKDYTNLQNYIYYMVYPFLLCLSELYAVIARIAGTMSYEVLRYAQAAFVGISVYFSYRIARELFRHVAAECLCLLFTLLFVPMWLYSQFLYGETFGVCMCLISIYFFLLGNRPGRGKTGREILYWSIAVIAFGITYIVRPALLVVFVAMAIIQVCLCIKNKIIFRLFPLGLMLIAGVFGQKLMSVQIGRAVGVDVDNGMPVISLLIAMGMQDNDPNNTGAGSYNGYNYNLFAETGYDQAEAQKLALQDIKRSLYRWYRNPVSMMEHNTEKILNQWTEPAYDAFTLTCKMEEPDKWVDNLYYNGLHDFVYSLLDCFQSLCYFMLTFWFLHLYKEERTAAEKTDPRDYLIGLILIGEVFFSILWEAKSRYIFPYMVIVIPCVAGSFVHFYNWLTGKSAAWMRGETI